MESVCLYSLFRGEGGSARSGLPSVFEGAHCHDATLADG